MAKVVVFGLLDFASLTHFYLQHDSPHEVAAFTVHEQYLPEVGEFEGLPVVPFEQVEHIYDPAEYNFFAPMSPRTPSPIWPPRVLIGSARFNWRARTMRKPKRTCSQVGNRSSLPRPRCHLTNGVSPSAISLVFTRLWEMLSKSPSGRKNSNLSQG